ncbi:hypothetical protein A7P96_04650 [Eikenella sp. NML03-A-027]|uniref:hypothetical protein n=1 Tax=Eikenella sp. NML03-A-027 TaxID=1795828 RepID=UPI0007E1B7A1|nr:hypothetical protein [Eikenella sp. NML03-A-027]OAM31584.1 hypothetical protein A7P96_04650 [Eikenella sp. NML03-A-027]
MADINHYWDLKDELDAVIDELVSTGDELLEEGRIDELNELISRRDEIKAELEALDDEFEEVVFFQEGDSLTFDV